MSSSNLGILALVAAVSAVWATGLWFRRPLRLLLLL